MTAHAQVVPEADGWSICIPGLPVAADGTTLDAAVMEMIEALREMPRTGRVSYRLAW